MTTFWPAATGTPSISVSRRAVRRMYTTGLTQRSSSSTADQLDLARTPNDHVAFGGGAPHFCLGAHIARVEIHALLRELLTRLVDLRPTGPTEWLPSTFISGPKHLPITFRKAPAPG